MTELAAKTPTQILARQMKEVRTRRGWTQQDLADRLQDLGLNVDQSTIARIEKGQIKRVTLDDALAIAAALGVQPVQLMVPMKADNRVALAPNLIVEPSLARRWIRGQRTLRPEDERTYFSEVSDLEWTANQRWGVHWMLSSIHDFVAAHERGENVAMADAIDRINSGLERFNAAKEGGRDGARN